MVYAIDHPYIWDNLLIGFEPMMAKGIPIVATMQLRPDFEKAMEDHRISEKILHQFDELINGFRLEKMNRRNIISMKSKGRSSASSFILIGVVRWSNTCCCHRTW